MQKINFKNLPDTSTPLNAENLNLLQDNIEEAIENIEPSGAGGESLPIGTELDFDGQASEIPEGWEQIDDPSEYSATEKVIGKMGDKFVYRKMVETTALPNTGQMIYPTGITNFGNCLNVYGWTSGGLMLNAIRANSPTFAIGAWCNDNGLYIETGSDRSSQTATAIIEYTKTTD